MAELKQVRSSLKEWEEKFYKEFLRKPQKADIDAAPSDIVSQYKRYSDLKKLQNNAIDVWGKELNKSQQHTKSTEKSDSEESITSSVMMSIGKKLAEKSLLTKSFNKSFSSRSLSSSKISNATQLNKPKGFGDVQLGSVKMDSVPRESFKKSEAPKNGPVIPALLMLQKAPIRNRMLATLPESSKLNHAADHNHQEDTSEIQSLLPLEDDTSYMSPVRKSSNTFQAGGNITTPSSNFRTESIENRENRSLSRTKNKMTTSVEPVENVLIQRSVTKNISVDDGTNRVECGSNYELRTCIEPVKRNLKLLESKNSSQLDVEINLPIADETSMPESSGKRKREQSFDAEKTPRSKHARINESETCDSNCDVEDLNVKQIEDTENKVDKRVSHYEQNLKTTRKRISRSEGSGKISSDNFVRLNMKVKKYRKKGGHAMTGAAAKRMAWKQRMKNRGTDSSDKSDNKNCFKCGQPGHWAKNCKGKYSSLGGKKSMSEFDWTMGSQKSGNNATEEADAGQGTSEVNFPSLAEAVSMAGGVKKTDTSIAADEDDLDELEYHATRTAFQVPTAPPPMTPLYELRPDGSLPDTPKEVFDALKKFGYTKFRPGQEQAVMRILCGLSTLVVLFTGAGKSLVYQLAAYLYATKGGRSCISLVISPLVSLMQDQVSNLATCVKGACIHNNMTKAQRKSVMESVASGGVHFLLLSPEMLVSGGGAGGIGLLSQVPSIAFACIDEAHCLSEWSHHFRPSYLMVCKVLRERYGVNCMLGLTATATTTTIVSVSQHFGIPDYKTATITGAPVPSNLKLSVSRDENKDEALLNLLQGERFSSCQSIIIYCTRREQTSRVSTLIRTCMKDKNTGLPKPIDPKPKKKSGKKKVVERLSDGSLPWDAECYHAGLTGYERKRIQNNFMSGNLRVVVATVAFGMGLDKHDIRGIIHYNISKTVESYIQEIGRAGRDGQIAYCHLFLDPMGQDCNELKRHIYSRSVDRVAIKKLVQRVFASCRCRYLNDVTKEMNGVDLSEFDKSWDADDDEINDAKDAKQNDSNDDKKKGFNPDSGSKRLCPGHERALSIEDLVKLLDMKEEGVSTLLCYLELHRNHWVYNQTPVYSHCSLQCYGGLKQLEAVAKKCPPVAVVIARQKGLKAKSNPAVEFNIVELSDFMGWESGPVKRELKLLQWISDAAGLRKSGVVVEFSDLSFHLRSPGDLSDDEIDEAVGFLFERVDTQEKTELFHLQNFYDMLKSVSYKSCWSCMDHVDDERSDSLRQKLQQYLDYCPPLEDGHITMLSFTREMDAKAASCDQEAKCDHEDAVRSDIRSFINLYSSDHALTGRSIARIFQGIESPNFQAQVWGRVRRFWRTHLDVDFNVLRQMATEELVRMK